jgi:hypothetical protein
MKGACLMNEEDRETLQSIAASFEDIASALQRIAEAVQDPAYGSGQPFLRFLDIGRE